MVDEQRREHYLVLPSNVRTLPGQTQNKTSHYRTALFKPLELKAGGDMYEVGLTDINFPHSWSDKIPAKRCEYEVAVADLKRPRKRAKVFNACLPAGRNVENYYSLENLISSLNDRRPQTFKGSFKIVPPDGKVAIDLAEGEGIGLTEFLADLMGFEKMKYYHVDGVLRQPTHSARVGTTVTETRTDKTTTIIDKTVITTTTAAAAAAATGDDTKREGSASVEAPPSGARFRVTAGRLPDLHAAMYNLYVYCNLVQESLVGDRMVKLLRTVPVQPQDRGKYKFETFQRVHYLPLSSSFFQYIEIMIADDTGEAVRFEWGKVIVTLHLRPRKSRTLTS